MATPAQGPQPKHNSVIIAVDEIPGTNMLKVDPEQFWLHRNEEQEAVWVCKRNHVHAHGQCFKVTFNKNGTPFTTTNPFEDDWVRSGLPDPKAPVNKLFDYTVEAPGFQPLDPQGGVKP